MAFCYFEDALKILFGLLVVLAVLYALRGRFRDSIVTMSNVKAPSCLEMVGNTTSEQDGHTYIIGSLRNNCEKTFGHVQVTFTLDRTDHTNLPPPLAYVYGRNLQA